MQKRSPVGMMLDFAHGRGIADSTPCAGRPDQTQASSAVNTTTLVLALAVASKAWWESRRPPGWTLEQHLADPSAGCSGTAQERALAASVAQWVRKGN